MKIAFITPRYGENILGGAEQLCKKLVEHLLKYYDIDVITTCAEDYVTWKNKFKEEVLMRLTALRLSVLKMILLEQIISMSCTKKY